jgi:uncharacterized protein (TIGR02145 family)
MKSKLAKFTQMASLGLALTFTLSCSGGDDNGGGTSSPSGGDELSSSSVGGGDNNSSSSVTGGGGTACTAADNTDTQYCSNGAMKTYGSTPSIGGRTYKTVVISNQTWMAENLNYNATGSKCYAEGVSGVSADSIAKNCATYGRLYDWATAMGIEAKYNYETWGGSDVKHQGICPTAWHLPSNAEWETLINSVGSDAATKLKATSGWYYQEKSGNGEDKYGFSALPGGRISAGQFIHSAGGGASYWHSSTEGSESSFYRWEINILGESILNYRKDKDDLYSVRCVKDN